jgi:hypothetical protein
VGAALAVVPGTALAAPNNVIKVDVGINRIKIGFSEAKVLKKMGTSPKRVQTGTNDFGSYRILVFGKRFKVTILDQRGVTRMSTMSGAQRTFDGIGVGSTRQQVRAAYAVMCERVPGQPGQQVCLTHEPAAGETATTFRMQNKVVSQVDVLTVVD